MHAGTFLEAIITSLCQCTVHSCKAAVASYRFMESLGTWLQLQCHTKNKFHWTRYKSDIKTTSYSRTE